MHQFIGDAEQVLLQLQLIGFEHQRRRFRADQGKRGHLAIGEAAGVALDFVEGVDRREGLLGQVEDFFFLELVVHYIIEDEQDFGPLALLFRLLNQRIDQPHSHEGSEELRGVTRPVLGLRSSLNNAKLVLLLWRQLFENLLVVGRGVAHVHHLVVLVLFDETFYGTLDDQVSA